MSKSGGERLNFKCKTVRFGRILQTVDPAGKKGQKYALATEKTKTKTKTKHQVALSDLRRKLSYFIAGALEHSVADGHKAF